MLGSINNLLSSINQSKKSAISNLGNESLETHICVKKRYKLYTPKKTLRRKPHKYIKHF